MEDKSPGRTNLIFRMGLAGHIAFLILSVGMILLGAELFTNGIEWFGHRLRVAEGAVGGVLAAVGTAMPETMVPIIAISFHRGDAGREIATGAILGAPLMLSTLAFFVTGVAVLAYASLGRRSFTMSVDHRVLGRDLKSFFAVYAVAIAAMFIPYQPVKILIAVLLVGAYVYYVRQTFRNSQSAEGEGPGPLHFHRQAEVPRLRIVVVQVFFALVLILVGARLFVSQVTGLSLVIGISSFVLASIITPIATELPEKFNSITWIRQRKDTLALGNISGAMVFQSSIPTAIGIAFTPWTANPLVVVTGLTALAASIFVWAEITWHKRLSPYTLLAGVVFYVPWLIFVLRAHG